MADATGGERAAMGGALSYKDVVLGACSLVLIFGSGAVGVWVSQYDKSIARLERELERERLSNVEQWNLVNDYKYRIGHLEKKAERLEEWIEAHNGYDRRDRPR